MASKITRSQSRSEANLVNKNSKSLLSVLKSSTVSSLIVNEDLKLQKEIDRLKNKLEINENEKENMIKMLQDEIQF